MWSQRILNYSLLILIGGVLLLKDAHAQNRPVSVIVSEATSGEFVDRLEAIGTLKANESVTLSSTVTEIVRAIHFTDGQRVAAGFILAEMTSQEEHAQLEEAKSLVAEARRQYERVKELTLNSSASESVLDQRHREYETAKARLLAIQSRLDDRLITAPFTGVVGIREISVGTLVEPGDPITTLDDDSVMKLDFTVPSVYLTSLDPGMPVLARAPALGSREFTGEISSINFRIDPLTRAVLVRAVLPNPEQILRPGLLMNVEVLSNPRSAIVIPEEAVIAQGQRHYVFTVDHDTEAQLSTAEKTAITVGARKPGWLEVVSGLSAGQQIVTRGVDALRSGSTVEVKALDTGNSKLTDLLEQAGNDD